MKRLLIPIMLCLSLAANAGEGDKPKKDAATVEQYEGVYVFTDCKPQAETEFLGTVKVSMSLGSGQYIDIRDKLLKRARKEYPNAEAIIIHTKEGGADKADVVKFK